MKIETTAVFLAQKRMLACPFCGATSIKIDSFPMFHALGVEQHYTECAVCLARGPRAFSALEAIDKWNERSMPL